MSPESIVLSAGTILMAGANIGAVVYLAKTTINRVNKHTEILPQITESLKGINESQRATTASLKELYDSRNEHSDRLTGLETTHRINGCESGGRRGVDPICRPKG